MKLFKTKIVSLASIIICVYSGWCQTPTRTFRTHFNYAEVKGVSVSQNFVYVNSANGFYRKGIGSDNIEFLDKRNGLSEMNVSVSYYQLAQNQLFIGYDSGTIDLIELSGEDEFAEISTIDFIKNSSAISTSKKILSIVSNEQKAFAATAFGLVEIDLKTLNISETYRNIGPNGNAVSISDVLIRNDSIYVKSSLGVLGGSLSPNINLLFFGNWELMKESSLFSLPDLPPDVKFVTTPNEIHSEGNNYWIADGNNGLVTNDSGSWRSIIPPGLPETSGYFFRKNALIGFAGEKGFQFENNFWTETPPPLPSDNNVLIDRFGNEWQVQNGNVRVASETGNFVFSQFNGLSGRAIDLALDRDDLLWIATSNGVTVIPTTNDFVSNPVQPFAPVYKNQRLLLQQIVNTLEIDGGNRKWFGTNNGLYCFSENTDKLIDFFDSKNSLLLDSQILDLMIDPFGELFILSGKGVVSYQTDAAEPKENLAKVTLFPNPVRPEFDGVFTIKGLTFDSKVKITTPEGSTVYSGFANGGLASWDLRIPSGAKAPTGVYLVFVSTNGFTEKFVGKFAIVQ